MKVASDKLKALLVEGQEYEASELHDLVTQVELEVADEDGGDFVIFNNKKYDVNKATYNVIRETKKSLIFRRYVRALYESVMKKPAKVSLLGALPVISWVTDSIDDWRYKRAWLDLCKLTFKNDYWDFELGGLTQGEVERVMRIFFRFQVALFQGGRAVPKKPSQGT